MTSEQLYLLLGAPALFNAVLMGLLVAYINAKSEAVNHRIDGLSDRVEAINRRFDDMRDLWRAELHRVEEVIDARLKHLEEH